MASSIILGQRYLPFAEMLITNDHHSDVLGVAKDSTQQDWETFDKPNAMVLVGYACQRREETCVFWPEVMVLRS